MPKKLLVLPGDNEGPSVMEAAESAIRAAADGIEIVRGEIGASALKRTGRALPADTVSYLAEADAVLSAHCDMSGTGLRNPLEDVRRQMNLFEEVRPFRQLSRHLGTKKADVLLITESPDSLPPVREYSTLYGITRESDISSDASEELFATARATAEGLGRHAACLVAGNGAEPESDRLLAQSFSDAFEGSDMRTEIMSEEKASCRLALDPSEFDTVISGPGPAGFLRGTLSGIIGGSGLTPVGFIGKEFGMFMPSRGFGEVSPQRASNPTAALLAAAMALRHLGESDGARAVEESVSYMYERRRTTADIGGKISPSAFTKGVLKHMETAETDRAADPNPAVR